MPALDVLRLEAPVIQAGMGGVARHELAAAVSDAGGLGTIAGVRADIAGEIASARRLTARPIAVNLLLPFLRAGVTPRTRCAARSRCSTHSRSAGPIANAAPAETASCPKPS